MDTEDIKELIKEGEGQELEFKRRGSETGSDISAFANTNDGIILVGVTDDGEIIGAADKADEQVASIAHTMDKPVYPEIERVRVDGKLILVVKVKKDSNLHIYKGYGRIRVGSTNKPMTLEELIKKGYELGVVKFDSGICRKASLKDIDEEKVRWFLKEARIQRGLDIGENTHVTEALMRLKLIENKKLTNAAVLLFGKEPSRFFTRPEVKCIRFKGTGVTGKMIDFKVIKGNLFDQLIESERFIYNNIKMAAWIEKGKLQRQEKWEYPPDAIREALANALCHREYETTASVQVRIFDDRMEFWNPGRLPEGWTVETLKQKHKSQPYNPLLLEHFFWVKYVEEVGTGTNKLIDWCKKEGLPEPLFEVIPGDLVVTFRKYRISEEDIEKLNERQKKAVEYLKRHKEITRSKYVAVAGCSEKTALRDLEELTKDNLAIRKGKGKKTYYILS